MWGRDAQCKWPLLSLGVEHVLADETTFCSNLGRGLTVTDSIKGLNWRRKWANPSKSPFIGPGKDWGRTWPASPGLWKGRFWFSPLCFLTWNQECGRAELGLKWIWDRFPWNSRSIPIKRSSGLESSLYPPGLSLHFLLFVSVGKVMTGETTGGNMHLFHVNSHIPLYFTLIPSRSHW